MVNNIDEGGLSKSNKVLVKIFLGAMSEKMLEKMDEIIKKKTKKNCYRVIVHAGTNDLTNNINLLNSGKQWAQLPKSDSHHCETPPNRVLRGKFFVSSNTQKAYI